MTNDRQTTDRQATAYSQRYLKINRDPYGNHATVVDPDVGTDGGVDDAIWTDGGVDDVTVDDPDAGTDGGVGVDDATEVVDAGKATAPHESLPVDDNNDNESVVIDDCDVIPTAMPAEGMQPLPDDTWLSTEMIVNLLRSSPSDSVHKAVPRGHKEYLLLRCRQQGKCGPSMSRTEARVRR